jgi:hypothetical protein
MKKLALIVTIAALSITVSMSVAFAEKPWNLNGDYAMIASGACFHSAKGFTEPTAGLYVPSTDTANVVWSATTAATAYWTFESDGTGTVWSGKNYVIDFYPGNTVHALDAPDSVNRMNPFGFTFTYTVTPYGDITVTPDPNPFRLPVLEGTVSKDKKTITLGSMNKLGGSPKGDAVCSVTRVLTKTANLPEPTP